MSLLILSQSFSESRHTQQSSSSVVRSEKSPDLKDISETGSFLLTLVGTEYLGLVLRGSSPLLLLLDVTPSFPETAPGGGKRLLTRHVPGTRGDARAEGLPGQGERWSGAPHQGAHPRW